MMANIEKNLVSILFSYFLCRVAIWKTDNLFYVEKNDKNQPCLLEIFSGVPWELNLSYYEYERELAMVTSLI